MHTKPLLSRAGASLYSEGFHVSSFDKQYSYNVRSRNDRSAQHLIITNYPTDL